MHVSTLILSHDAAKIGDTTSNNNQHIKRGLPTTDKQRGIEVVSLPIDANDHSQQQHVVQYARQMSTNSGACLGSLTKAVTPGSN